MLLQGGLISAAHHNQTFQDSFECLIAEISRFLLNFNFCQM